MAGIVQGLGPNGQPISIKATPDGSLHTEEAGGDPLQVIARLLANVLDEQRATRLALQDFVNSGRDEQIDYLELAQELQDDDEE